MQITVSGHGLELTEPLKDYAIKKISKLDEFFSNIVKVEVTLDARNTKDSKRSQVAEVSLWAAGKKAIRAAEAGENMYASIDLVLAELEKQLKKYKDIRVEERRRKGEKIKQISRTFKPEIVTFSEPQIVKRSNFKIDTMTVEEAQAELKIFGNEFIVFRNAETEEINLLQGEKVTEPGGLLPLSHEDAAKIINDGKKKVVAYLNNQTNQINVLYKRQSGNLGLIEPAF